MPQHTVSKDDPRHPAAAADSMAERVLEDEWKRAGPESDCFQKAIKEHDEALLVLAGKYTGGER